MILYQKIRRLRLVWRGVILLTSLLIVGGSVAYLSNALNRSSTQGTVVSVQSQAGMTEEKSVPSQPAKPANQPPTPGSAISPVQSQPVVSENNSQQVDPQFAAELAVFDRYTASKDELAKEVRALTRNIGNMVSATGTASPKMLIPCETLYKKILNTYSSLAEQQLQSEQANNYRRQLLELLQCQAYSVQSMAMGVQALLMGDAASSIQQFGMGFAYLNQYEQMNVTFDNYVSFGKQDVAQPVAAETNRYPLYPGNAGNSGTSYQAVQSYTVCYTCQGRGSCNVCRGSGHYSMYGQKSERCSACGGSGKCWHCQGSGRQ